MSLFGDIYRHLHSLFTDKPSRFGWVIIDKLAASGRPMTPSQLAWVAKNGIKSVLTIREYPLPATKLVSHWQWHQLQTSTCGKLWSSAG